MAQLRLEHERVERAHRERIEELKSHLAGVIDRTTRIRTAYDKEKRQLLNQVRKRNATVVHSLSVWLHLFPEFESSDRLDDDERIVCGKLSDWRLEGCADGSLYVHSVSCHQMQQMVLMASRGTAHVHAPAHVRVTASICSFISTDTRNDHG